MRQALLLIAIALSLTIRGAAQQGAAEYQGALEPELVAGEPNMSLPLLEATASQRRALGTLAPADAPVATGELTWMRDRKLRVFLVLLQDGSRTLFADVDDNRSIDAREQVPLTLEGLSFKGLLRLPLRDKAFTTYPVAFSVGRTAKLTPQADKPSQMYAMTSYQILARGRFDLKGRQVLVQLVVDPKELQVQVDKGYSYVDTDGDGKIDTGFTSPEMSYGYGEPPIFRIGSDYVSIQTADLASRRLVMVSRDAAEYQRIELRAGSEMPDFSFTDLEGTGRHLSDFRGQYVLLDFWGTWCGPCVGEIPFLKKAYEAFHAQGFEIIGMDNELPDNTKEDFDKGLERVRKFVEEKGVTWPQARTESIKPLYTKRFQIVAWPTLVLLDPQGRIVSVGRTGAGELALRGEALQKSIEGLILKR